MGIVPCRNAARQQTGCECVYDLLYKQGKQFSNPPGQGGLLQTCSIREGLPDLQAVDDMLCVKLRVLKPFLQGRNKKPDSF